MSKRKRARVLADNEAKAVAKMLRISPQKLNLVAQMIRGKKVASALADLEFSQKRIAKEVEAEHSACDCDGREEHEVR